jgi:aspartate/methionine/tyrosine aminotransferase
MDRANPLTRFSLPPFPYDLLDDARAVAAERFGTVLDFSIGNPFDPPPAEVVAALSTSDSERGYPSSVGSTQFRSRVSEWFGRQCDVVVDPQHVGATIGLKEIVAGLPQWMHLRNPERDTVLYPAVSYPSYAMGASLAGLRSVAVPVDEKWELNLAGIDQADIDRALFLWVNTPGNPAGGLDDLDAIAAWGRRKNVPVFSDECYIEFTWDGPPRTILRTGSEGVVAIHSLSKRSNLAGVRAGFYAGDPDLVYWLQEIRKHAGLMTPGPSQAAATVALSDQVHVEVQRDRYERRLRAMIDIFGWLDIDVPMPRGGFYLWVPAPENDSWGLTNRLAEEVGMIVAPGEFYGEAGASHVRVALVRPEEDIETIRGRLSAS